ncbi:hypothetical protein DY000_02024566 [Brassica cretica]|uniref:Uncharacterized protein n=1 Tax=Brassica cretica TaxID=69181 RepID=A0ABQ7ELR7_BRACR|nr:hypothetical protein DY000_02024566 [Brassica cretica]
MSLTAVDGLTFQENIGNSLSYLFLALSSTNTPIFLDSNGKHHCPRAKSGATGLSEKDACLNLGVTITSCFNRRPCLNTMEKARSPLTITNCSIPGR